MSEQLALSEHQSANDTSNTGNPTAYIPDENERKTVKLVQRLFERGKKHRTNFDSKWLDYYKMFRGRQWKEQRPSYRHSEVINMVFSTIQSMVPIITDSRPKFEFLPQNPADSALAKILTDVASNDWVSNNWSYQLTEVVYDAHIYGTGLASVEYDQDAKHGAGSITFQSEEIFINYPDPNAIDCNTKCLSWVKAEPVDVDILKHEYPDKAHWIKPDLMDLSQTNKQDFNLIKFKSPVEQKTTVEGSSPYDLANTDKAIKFTAWVMSHETVEEESDVLDEQGMPVTDPITGPKKEYIKKLKYPNGRKICMVNGMILDDVANPYEDGKFPFARLINYQDPRSFYGISEVEQLESPQKIFNKVLSFALDTMTLMGNPIWVVDNTSGIDTDNLFNRPGLVIEKEPGSEARREAGVQISSDAFQLTDRLRSWFNEQAGSTDVTAGAVPKGVTAASAIQSLQEAAQTRLRLKSRNVDAFLQDIGQLWISRAFQFYDVPRVYRLTGDENANKYFKMHIEKHDQGDGSYKKVAVIRPYSQPVDGSEPKEELQEKKFEIQGDFDVRVSTGSSLPFAKAEQAAKAYELFDRGIIDAQEVLKTVEYPNYEAVNQRMEQQKALQAQQAPPPQ